MAHIERRGTSYRARYRDPSGAAHSKSFDRKSDAAAFLTNIEHSKLSGGYVDLAAGKVLFQVYAEEWRRIQAHAPGTRRTIESRLRVHVYPYIGNRPIASIRRTEIQALITRLSLPPISLAPQTVITIRKDISSVFLAAVEDGLIAKSPVIKIGMPTPPPQAIGEVLTGEQVQLLRSYLPPRYQALVTVGAGTGMRPGELFGLAVSRVDFLRKNVKVDQQLTRRLAGDWDEEGRTVELARLKSRASYRTIPVGQTVIDGIAAHIAEFGVCEGLGGLIFTNAKGEAVRENTYTRAWKGAVERMRKDGKGEGEFPDWATPHDLRHYYASVLIRGGLGVKVVQARLGHAKATTTLDTYTHLFDDEEDRTREVMERAMGGDKGMGTTGIRGIASGGAGSRE